MNYQKQYDLLIQKAQSREKPDCYTESHHIVPKSLGGLDIGTNLVHLTAREHCFAHLLLAKIHGGKMWHAIHYMVGIHKLTTKAYAIAKEKKAEEMRGENNPSKRLEVIEKISKSLAGNQRRKGIAHTEEAKKLISESCSNGKHYAAKKVKYNGQVFSCVKELAKFLNINHGTLRCRILDNPSRWGYEVIA